MILRENEGEETTIIESEVELNSSEDDIDISNEEKEIHENMIDNDYCTKFLLSNARSLAPKITSLIDCMNDLTCDFAMITETWFRGGGEIIQ